jgi:predicted ATPase
MFLKKITLTNFKSHDSIEIPFLNAPGLVDDSEPIRKNTYILGENGTGKSTLLKAIALITAGSDALGELLVNPESWIKNGKSFAEIRATIVTAEGQDRSLALKIKRGDQLRSIIVNNNETLGQIDAAIGHADRNYFVVAYGASRYLSSGSFNRKDGVFSNKRSQCVGNLFNSSSLLNPLTSWAMELDYQKRNGLEIVRNALNRFLPTTQFHGIDKKNGRLLFKNQDGIIPLEHLSDGYQSMAAWIGDLLYRVTSNFSNYKKPLDARGLLLIDEIDLHLHPKWQRELYSFISRNLPNFQVVTTTHSPLTAQQANEGELFALCRGKEKIDIVPFEGSPQKMLINQLLMSPVFGLLTDESLEVESAKKEYDTLLSKSKPSSKDKERIGVLSAKVLEKKPSRFINEKHQEEMALLSRIKESMDGIVQPASDGSVAVTIKSTMPTDGTRAIKSVTLKKAAKKKK